MAERVLMIRWSAIGDIVMALPVAASIRASGVHKVAWMADAGYIELVDGHSAIASVFAFDRGKFRRNWMLPWRWREQLRAYSAPRKFEPTIAIDFQGHTKTALALKFSGAKRRVVLNPKDVASCLLATDVVRTDADIHAIESNLQTLPVCGIDERKISFDLLTSSECVIRQPYVTLHLGTNHIKKQWRISRFRELAKQITTTIVLVGGKGEFALRDQFLEGGIDAVDLVGKLSLRGLSEVLSKSSLHISCDTGSAHIAAAFGVPCVTIFGHMSPKQFHPYNQPEAVVYADGDIERVTVTEVLEKVHQRLVIFHAN